MASYPKEESFDEKLEKAGIVRHFIRFNIIVCVLTMAVKFILKEWEYLKEWREVFVFERDITPYLSLSSKVENLIMYPWTIATHLVFFDLQNLSQVFYFLFSLSLLYWAGTFYRQYNMEKYVLPIYLLGGIGGGVVYLIARQFFSGESYYFGFISATYALLGGLAALIPRHRYKGGFILQDTTLRTALLSWLLIELVFLSLSGSGGDWKFANWGGAALGYLIGLLLEKPMLDDKAITVNES